MEIDYTAFFYNPNIRPQREYLICKDENIRLVERHSVSFIDVDYDTDNWSERAKGMEWEPERETRYTMYFDMRFEQTALYVAENGFGMISSSLGISHWENMQQVSECGRRVVARYPDMVYWDYSWRKQGSSSRMTEVSEREEFYQQEYRGCVYFLRDASLYRKSQGHPLIKTGQLHYRKGERG